MVAFDGETAAVSSFDPAKREPAGYVHQIKGSREVFEIGQVTKRLQMADEIFGNRLIEPDFPDI